MSSTTIERTSVESAMGSVGYGQYRHLAGDVASYLSRNGVTPEAVKEFASGKGVRIEDGIARQFVGLLTVDTSSGEPDTSGYEATADFDTATACEVIRAFIGGDFSNEEVDALLILAGLEDEPVVEPEPEAEATFPDEGGMAATLARIEATLTGLVGFARGHGYTG